MTLLKSTSNILYLPVLYVKRCLLMRQNIEWYKRKNTVIFDVLSKEATKKTSHRSDWLFVLLYLIVLLFIKP